MNPDFKTTEDLAPLMLRYLLTVNRLEQEKREARRNLTRASRVARKGCGSEEPQQ